MYRYVQVYKYNLLSLFFCYLYVMASVLTNFLLKNHLGSSFLGDGESISSHHLPVQGFDPVRFYHFCISISIAITIV